MAALLEPQVSINLIWKESYFFDAREKEVNATIANAINDRSELNSDFQTILKRLNNSKYYKSKFKIIYGHVYIGKEQVIDVIIQYHCARNSFNSKYDDALQGKGKFENDEYNGYQLYIQRCQSCHQEPLSDPKLKNEDSLSNKHLTESQGTVIYPTLRNPRYSSPTAYMENTPSSKIS